MNRHLRQVFLAYLLVLLAAFTYVPWYGRPQPPWEANPCVRYAPIWSPPQTIGYLFYLDAGRLFLEGLSLSMIFLSAVASLWGGEPKTSELRAQEAEGGGQGID